MPDRNYYVLCDSNCKFPSMTSEQILAAIAEATGNTPTNVDDAFVTKIREMNASQNLRFWIGTSAEFNALTERDGNTLYILTDDSTLESIDALISDFDGRIEVNSENVTKAFEQIAAANSGIKSNASGIEAVNRRIDSVDVNIMSINSKFVNLQSKVNANKQNIETIFDAARTLTADNGFEVVTYYDDAVHHENVSGGMYMVRVTRSGAGSTNSFMFDFSTFADTHSCVFKYNTDKGESEAMVRAVPLLVGDFSAMGVAFHLKVVASAASTTELVGFTIEVRKIGADLY